MKLKPIWLTLTLGLIATPSFAQDVLDTGDTAWIIVSTALVMMMTPAGLALFYGGIRVEHDDEIQGLDNTLHGERGFEIM